jgi:hypothetical protein
MRAYSVLVLSIVVGQEIGSQTPERVLPAAVPTGVALALSDDVFGEMLQSGQRRSLPLVMGAAPEGFPPELIPRGSRTVAGLDRMQRGVIVAVPGDTASARASVARDLREKGWGPMAQDSSSGGFMATEAYGFYGRFLCKGEQGVSIRTTPIPTSLERTPDGGPLSYVTITHLRENAPCGEQFASRRMRGMPRGIAFPTMRAPAGASSGNGGGGGSESSRYTTTELSTEISVPDLATHYRDEIARSGWTVGDVTTVEGVATVAVRARDSDGRDWRGALIVADVGPNERHVTVMISRARGRR